MKALAFTWLAVLGIGVRIYFGRSSDVYSDTTVFTQWILAAAASPWPDVYAASNAPLPPLTMVLFRSIGVVYNGVIKADPGWVTLHAWFKICCCCFDGLASALVVPFGLLTIALWLDMEYALHIGMAHPPDPALVIVLSCTNLCVLAYLIAKMWWESPREA